MTYLAECGLNLLGYFLLFDKTYYFICYFVSCMLKFLKTSSVEWLAEWYLWWEPVWSVTMSRPSSGCHERAPLLQLPTANLSVGIHEHSGRGPVPDHVCPWLSVGLQAPSPRKNPQNEARSGWVFRADVEGKNFKIRLYYSDWKLWGFCSRVKVVMCCWLLKQQLKAWVVTSHSRSEIPLMLMEDALHFLFTQQRLLLADNVSLVTRSRTGVIV